MNTEIAELLITKCYGRAYKYRKFESRDERTAKIESIHLILNKDNTGETRIIIFTTDKSREYWLRIHKDKIPDNQFWFTNAEIENYELAIQRNKNIDSILED